MFQYLVWKNCQILQMEFILDPRTTLNNIYLVKFAYINQRLKIQYRIYYKSFYLYELKLIHIECY